MSKDVHTTNKHPKPRSQNNNNILAAQKQLDGIKDIICFECGGCGHIRLECQTTKMVEGNNLKVT